MHNTIALHLLTAAQVSPKHSLDPPAQLPPSLYPGHGVGYPFSQFDPAVLTMFPPSFFCPSSQSTGN